MNKELVETCCKEKESQLLSKYFGNLVKEAALEQPETIGEYTKDLPLKIEAEYRVYLEGLWKEYAPSRRTFILMINRKMIIQDHALGMLALHYFVTKDNTARKHNRISKWIC